MADRSETVWKSKGNLYFRTEFGEVTVSNADTVTLDGFSSTVTLANVVLWKQSDGTEMTSTNATADNVVIITGAGTNVVCVYMAYGVRA